MLWLYILIKFIYYYELANYLFKAVSFLSPFLIHFFILFVHSLLTLLLLFFNLYLDTMLYLTSQFSRRYLIINKSHN